MSVDLELEPLPDPFLAWDQKKYEALAEDLALRNRNGHRRYRARHREDIAAKNERRAWAMMERRHRSASDGMCNGLSVMQLSQIYSPKFIVIGPTGKRRTEIFGRDRDELQKWTEMDFQ